MKVTAAWVQSIDGFITNGDQPGTSWASVEDQELFSSLRNQATAIVMGRKTYEVAAPYIKHREGLLRLVMTESPQKYSSRAIPSQLEFTSDSPLNIVEKLENSGHKTALVLGGASVYSAFFRSQLIDELLITIEPVIFGTGIPALQQGPFSEEFSLASSTVLNDKGTLHLVYHALN